MFKFKNSLALRIFNFAIKIEKMSMDILRIKKVNENYKAFADLQKSIEKNMDVLYVQTKEAEEMIKNMKNEER